MNCPDSSARNKLNACVLYAQRAIATKLCHFLQFFKINWLFFKTAIQGTINNFAEFENMPQMIGAKMPYSP